MWGPPADAEHSNVEILHYLVVKFDDGRGSAADRGGETE